MKFQGYGQVWDEARKKIIVDFESTATEPGIVEVTDQATISVLINRGYQLANENKIESDTPDNPIIPESTDVKPERKRAKKDK